MRLLFSAHAWNDYIYWSQQNAAVLARLNELIQNARRHPFTGLGKPEQLKGSLAGYWSRRITQEHRMVYRVTGAGEEQTIAIMQCRHHY